ILDGAGSPDPIVVTSADSVTVDFAVETYVDSTEVLTGTTSTVPYELRPTGTVETVVTALGRGYHLLQDGIAPAGTAAPSHMVVAWMGYPRASTFGVRSPSLLPGWPGLSDYIAPARDFSVAIPQSARTTTFPAAAAQSAACP